MALSRGTIVGSCEIVDLIGSGGMGEVYRGRDTKLGRDVAVKALPSEFSGDAERVARFEREAQVLASLNHPNIAIIHDLQEVNGSKYLILELVNGDTLADLIARGPVPIDEALNLARQIADALEAAHDRGIIHRDLKPANIKITADGRVKVLDFGLAKVYEQAPSSPVMSNSPTLSAMQTMGGVVLGTAAYMSPEQARGRPVDKRADIWAFGAVLYEMVTGRQLFSGEDISETLASVITKEPDLDGIPPQVRRVLSRCLQKDPKKRLRDISAVSVLLEEEPATTVAAVSSGVGWFWPSAFSVAVLLAVVMGVAWYCSISLETRSSQRPSIWIGWKSRAIRRRLWKVSAVQRRGRWRWMFRATAHSSIAAPAVVGC
jgi:serine/threonine-protein kinase